MIGDFPRRFLFIHIPGTAGEGIEAALLAPVSGRESLKELGMDELCRHALPGAIRRETGRNYRVRGLTPAHECLEYFEDLDLTDRREVLAVVRNPYDRALAQIMHLLRTDSRAAQVFRGPTWAADLRALAAYDGVLGHDLRATQVDWLTGRDGRLHCDRVLRFEQLEADWAKLCADWRMDPAVLPRIAVEQPLVPWWEFYDEEAAEAIAHKYARDFEAFGYGTRLPVSESGEISKRTVWFGHGDPPDREMLAPGLKKRHGRIELPGQVTAAIRLYGCLERMSFQEGGRLLSQCRAMLVPGGEMMVHTIDVDFLARLIPAAYEEGSRQEAFVRTYVNECMPDIAIYAPSLVLSRILLNKELACLYDEALLVEVLEQAGFSVARYSGGGDGEIVVRAVAG